MSQITASAVNELRQKTGAGMMDCKKALTETAGDIEKAVDVLRKKGLSAAAKKAGRVAAEGQVTALVAEGGKVGVVTEVNCETDFVGMGPEFKAIVDGVASQIAAKNPADVDSLLAQASVSAAGKDVKTVITEAVAKIGENIQIRRFQRYETKTGLLGSYIHAGGKIGVLLELASDNAAALQKPEAQQLAKDLCLHVAANKPLYLTPSEIAPEVLARERDIARDQAKASGKPEAFLDKIVEGKLAKFGQEICLLEQGFVKDPDTTVKKLLDQQSKALGGKLSVARFTRFELGEGIEKKKDDFAAEVAAQAGLKN
jgi:elongation factor Ts